MAKKAIIISIIKVMKIDEIKETSGLFKRSASTRFQSTTTVIMANRVEM
jgi:hypothetical protein